MLLPVRPRAQARPDRSAGARRGERDGKAPARADRSSQDRLQEAVGLAEAIGLKVRLAESLPLPRPRPATLLGSGKVEEIAQQVREQEVGLVIIDHAVSPIQQRNLEKAWGAKVLDRTGLILEIFGERALTREGRLQVELAHLTYQRGRLVRSWTHLERQRGGFGFLGGPGEAQIETDRRLIQERIDAIKKDLAGVIRTRGLHRASRQRIPLPVAAIVGYTNAGKSTLFNRLTGAAVLAIDQVFATLDPTMREISLPSGRRIVLSDTVGFISDLPTNLVAAFRATLEEVIAANLILHVRDVSHPESEAQYHDVVAVLGDLGIDADSDGAPILEVWNKADKLAPGGRTEVEQALSRRNRPAVLVSALTGEGIEALRAQLDTELGRHDEVFDLEIPADQGRLLSWLHANAEVLDQKTEGSGAVLARIRIEPAAKGKLAGQLKRAGLSLNGMDDRK
ncbi:MAG TPA: GTPase HflX [Hyphomicrobiaceae bacterium]|nr:GTPase HflX [Hyphomicrobiaceae bacterium]